MGNLYKKCSCTTGAHYPNFNSIESCGMSQKKCHYGRGNCCCGSLSDHAGYMRITGPQGPIGPTGELGATGPQGPIGPAGERGATGPQGPIGSAGERGATGPQGVTGPQGSDGFTPQIGPNGNWFIDNVDTGHPSCCPAAAKNLIPSDARLKKDIFPLNKVDSFFMALNPVKYRYKSEANGKIHYGLIAQEVERALGDGGLYIEDFAGLNKITDKNNIGEYNYSLNYDEFIPILIKIVQNLKKEIEDIKKNYSRST